MLLSSTLHSEQLMQTQVGLALFLKKVHQKLMVTSIRLLTAQQLIQKSHMVHTTWVVSQLLMVKITSSTKSHSSTITTMISMISISKTSGMVTMLTRVLMQKHTMNIMQLGETSLSMQHTQ